MGHHARPRPPGELPATAAAARAPWRCALLRRTDARHVGRCLRSPSRGASPARLTLVHGRRITRSAARRATASSDERTSGSGGVEAVNRPPGRPGSPHRAYRAGRPRGGFGCSPRAPAQRRRSVTHSTPLHHHPQSLDLRRIDRDEVDLACHAPRGSSSQAKSARGTAIANARGCSRKLVRVRRNRRSARPLRHLLLPSN